jgi:hypothetical protein
MAPVPLPRTPVRVSLSHGRDVVSALLLVVALVATMVVVAPTSIEADNGPSAPLDLGDRTYILTCDAYLETAAWGAAAIAEFGPQARIADFGDLAAAASGRFSTLYDWLGVSTSVGITLSGQQYLSDTRAYFIVPHTSLPGGFSVHAYIAASGSGLNSGSGVAYPRLNVGSWYFARRLLVDVTDVSPRPTVSCVLPEDQTITFAALSDRAYSSTPFSLSASASSGLVVTFTAAPGSNCSVSGIDVTLLGAGTCTIVAEQAGSRAFNAAPSVTRSFAVSQASQTLTFPEIDTDLTYGDAPFAPTLTSDGAGLTPALTSTTPDVCTVSGGTVTIVGAGRCDLTASQAGDGRYLPASEVQRSFTVAPLPVTVGGSRVYDGTRALAPTDLTIVGLVGEDRLTIAGSATVASPDAAEGVTLDISSLTFADGTGKLANYEFLSEGHAVTITRRPVLGIIAVDGRDYDGTVTVEEALITARTIGPVPGAEASSGVVTVDGVTDDVVLSGGTAMFAAPDADESTPTTVTLTGATLTGARAENYVLQGDPTTTATISRRTLTVTGGFTVADREYDGTSDATLASAGLELVGIAPGDTVSWMPAVAFDTPDVGPTVTVRLTDASVLTGPLAGSYRLVLAGSPTATAAITPRALTVSGGSFTVADRVYDGTRSATVTAHDLTLAGFVSGESAADVAWSPVAEFDMRTAGTGKVVRLVGGAVLGGTKGGNYVLDVAPGSTPTATATISPRPVTVAGATATPRAYDGTTAVAVSGASLVGVVGGDAVALSNATSGAASSRDSGTRLVTTAMTLVGTDATNYVLFAQPSITVTITPRTAQVSLGPVPARTYDGSGQLDLGPGAFRISGLVEGDAIGARGVGRLPFRDAGTRTLTVDPEYTAAQGTLLENYVLPRSLTGTVTVVPRPVTVRGLRVLARPWDGTTTAVLDGAVLDGVLPGDAVSLRGITFGTFASAAPGTHAVRADVALNGPAAGNYVLGPVPALTGTITRATATLRVVGGLTQFASGPSQGPLVTVVPEGAGRIVITYTGVGAPTTPGAYPFTVRLESTTYEAAPIEGTLTVAPLESLLPTGGSDDPATRDAGLQQLLARMALLPDGSRAQPVLGPQMAADGSVPALGARELSVLEDGERTDSRLDVIDRRLVRVESAAGGFAIELSAAAADGTALPVDPDGTLVLVGDGRVEVAGTSFLPGSTVEAWIFSQPTFLGTTLVRADGSFAAVFTLDGSIPPGDHTIQLNALTTDSTVRSVSLGVRVSEAPVAARERIALIAELGDGPLGGRGPVVLLLLAGSLGAAVTRWWLAGGRRRDDEEDEELDGDGQPVGPGTGGRPLAERR